MFKEYTGIEYLAIDIANQFGLDKKEFETRIQWVKDNQHNLMDLVNQADEPILYTKAVNHFYRAIKGLPTGHAVALDAVCSGLQLMSVMTGCKSGCEITGLIDPNKRVDAYTEVTKYMNELLGDEAVEVDRKDAKASIMTSLYGSKAKPIEIFGEDTPQLEAFYQALEDKCEGAYTLLGELIDAWDSTKTFNHWVLPDGYNVYIPIMVEQNDRVKIEELDYTMSVQTRVNKPLDYSVSLAANVIHSVDAYVLRSLVRRCNYNPKQVNNAIQVIEAALNQETSIDSIPEEAIMPIHLYLKTGLADIVCIKDINNIVDYLPFSMKQKLLVTLKEVIKYPPFEVITIHDSFAVLPNNCNRLRYWYKEILAELAESNILEHLLSQIMEEDIKYNKLDNNLAPLIRNSNYGLC